VAVNALVSTTQKNPDLIKNQRNLKNVIIRADMMQRKDVKEVDQQTAVVAVMVEEEEEDHADISIPRTVNNAPVDLCRRNNRFQVR